MKVNQRFKDLKDFIDNSNYAIKERISHNIVRTTKWQNIYIENIQKDETI